MSSKHIHNKMSPDWNIARNKPHKLFHDDIVPSLLPPNFVVQNEELDVLKWALQFYLYAEDKQKVSGKIYLTEITDQNKRIALKLLEKIM